MLRMRGVLADKDIPDNAGVAIEFNIPHTSNRIYFLYQVMIRIKKFYYYN